MRQLPGCGVSKAPISLIVFSLVSVLVAAVVFERYPTILMVINAIKEGSFMETVWNLDLYEFFKPVGPVVLNIMAGVTASLVSSRFGYA